MAFDKADETNTADVTFRGAIQHYLDWSWYLQACERMLERAAGRHEDWCPGEGADCACGLTMCRVDYYKARREVGKWACIVERLRPSRQGGGAK